MSKYRNEKAKLTIDGEEVTFDSKLEKDIYIKLWGNPSITNLKRQVKYNLVPKCGKNRPVDYVADFVFDQGGKTIVADAKGIELPDFKIKKKLMKWLYGIDVVLLKKDFLKKSENNEYFS